MCSAEHDVAANVRVSNIGTETHRLSLDVCDNCHSYMGTESS